MEEKNTIEFYSDTFNEVLFTEIKDELQILGFSDFFPRIDNMEL